MENASRLDYRKGMALMLLGRRGLGGQDMEEGFLWTW